MTYPSTTSTPFLFKLNFFEHLKFDIFFIKMEYVLANLEGSNFKNFLATSAPTMVGPP